MEFLQQSRRRSLLSEVIYILLNVGFAVAALIAVTSTNSLLVGLFIVLLGKWRVFAVRPHFWAANIMANTIDFIVSIGYVVFLHTANGNWLIQLVLTLLYVMWLLFIKPQSKHNYVLLQAFIAILAGVSALMQVSYDWIATAVVLCMWLIGFMGARHALTVYKEPHAQLYSLIWGLVFAELGWVFYHWTFAFDVGLGQIKLAFVTVIAVLLSFLAERVYAVYRHHKKIVMSEILLPLLFTVSIIIVGFVRGTQLYSSVFGQ
jgi:hypothetical protein